MGKKKFDISLFSSRSGSPDRASKPSPSMERDKKLVKEMISELSEMSLDEMMEALSALDSPGSRSEPRPSGPTLPKVSIDEVYQAGRDAFDAGREDMEDLPGFIPGAFDDPTPESDAVDASEIGDAIDSFLTFAPEQESVSSKTPAWRDAEDVKDVDMPYESPVSGVVRDEIVLSLLQSELVTMSQVFDAIRHRTDDRELWRLLELHPELDPLEIRTAVAAQRGYAFQPYLETEPSKEFILSIMEMVPPHDLARMIGAGLLPIQMDLEVETVEYTLVVLSGDPLDRRAQSALLSAPVQVVCRFTPAEVVAPHLENVRQWLLEEGFDFPEPEPEAIAGNPEHVAHTPEAKDLGSQDAVSSADSSSSTAPERGTSRRRDRRGRAQFDRVVKQLLSEGIISDTNVAEASTLAAKQGGEVALWRFVADLVGVDRERVYETAAHVYAFKKEIIGPGRPDHDFVRLTMETLAEEHHEELLEKLLVPFEHTIDFDTGSGRIVFVTPDPTSPEINRLVHELDLGRFELRYASESQILRLYDELYPRKNEYLERMSGETDAFDLGMSYDDDDVMLDEDALEAEISRSKLINLFEAALVEATRQGVSDIHIYPNPNRQVEIHFRTDGRLKKWHTEDKVHPEAFLAVVKDNSTNVDRFERDMAQDGFIQREIDGALIRFRVSILPIASANQELRAESIVIRILDDRKVLTDIRKLGMLDSALANFNKAIRQPHGMVILTGPTGSGKSTTLVAALYQVVTPEVNVLTVEDPVEYIIKGVRQIKLSHKLNLEGALRAILRHDPDIVMVGEMRDRDTAELAIKLANTGHLTFSTLHTNDAPAAVSRLYKMGVEPFLIAYAINLVVAQRLIRVVCPACKEVDENPDRTMMAGLGFTEEEMENNTFYKAKEGGHKCPTCNGRGYKGRRAVCETLYFTPAIRTLVAESGEAIDEDAIKAQAIKDGMLTLADSARVLVNMGETTVDEMMRMTSSG
jgi:type IV pilus assembly protein PilB